LSNDAKVTRKKNIDHIKDLKPDQQNRRKHNPRNVGMIVDALHEVGAARSIVIDEEGNILAGNATIEAAAEAGIEKVLVVDADGETIVAVRRSGLTPEQKRRLGLYDNRTAELASWDVDRLLTDLEVGFDFDGLFYEDELKELLAGLLEEEPLKDPGARVSEAERLREVWNVKLGQVWELGDHRLACIDSTDGEAVAHLLNGTKASLHATDPPYGANAGNISFTAQRDDIEAITKDDLEGVEMQAFLERAFAAWIPHLKDDCAWYLWHPMLTQGYFAAAAAAAADLIIHRQIIWKKEQFIFGRGDYHWRHELCFYGWRRGHRPPFYGARNQETVWEVPWGVKRSEVGHHTAKPVELFARPMRNHLRRGDVCVEPFCGSVSQIIAAEQQGVYCFAADIEPRFVALSIQRWADATGKEPKLLE